MRFASFLDGGRPRVAEVRDDILIPLQGLGAIDRDTSQAALREAGRCEAEAIAVEAAKLLPIVPNPSKVLCVGLNYLAHVEETARELPTYPVLFAKFASSLLAADDPIVLPPESEQVDYEGELAVVIGATGRRIPEADAAAHVLGYTVANDITVRDYQYKTHQWIQGKAWEASTPLGPYLSTPDEIDVDAAGLRTVLNGDVVQESDLSHLIFSVPRLIATISEFTSLVPGDVILTGTPSGVGYRREPQVFLADGDTIEVSIEGLAPLQTSVSSEPAPICP